MVSNAYLSQPTTEQDEKKTWWKWNKWEGVKLYATPLVGDVCWCYSSHFQPTIVCRVTWFYCSLPQPHPSNNNEKKMKKNRTKNKADFSSGCVHSVDYMNMMVWPSKQKVFVKSLLWQLNHHKHKLFTKTFTENFTSTIVFRVAEYHRKRKQQQQQQQQ